MVIFKKLRKTLEKLESKTKVGSLRNQQIRTLQQQTIFAERFHDFKTANEVRKDALILQKNKKSAGWHNKFIGKK